MRTFRTGQKKFAFTSSLRQRLPYFFALLALLIGIGIGWGFGHASHSDTTNQSTRTALRLSGYTFISPLLTCDYTLSGNSPQLSKLQESIQKTITSHQDTGDITKASVYFRDLQSGIEFGINNGEKFFPASLKKLPLMMQYYREAESNPSLLTTPKVLEGTQDFNAGTVIPPSQAPQYGTSYTSQQLIDYMIKYSDNISFEVLFRSLGEQTFNKIYQQMQLHYPDAYLSTSDYATPYQFSLFFRTLYSATYLSDADSERALALLTQTDFNDGLVAGVPSTVKVAHKFGVSAVPQTDGTTQGELHDCGIIYDNKHPYLLCVMTKSLATDIKKVEQTISDISAVAYKGVEKDYQ